MRRCWKNSFFPLENVNKKEFEEFSREREGARWCKNKQSQGRGKGIHTHGKQGSGKNGRKTERTKQNA